ncbi:MAG: endonuclease/exonuclease/phosphatase family protein [Gammaproteobacteria bacterium]|nr:endonuclease/exonuclease/phosphatase family protein [Gammaproteobacteria bacterium]
MKTTWRLVIKLTLATACLTALASCARQDIPVAAGDPVVTIMAFNVENLFDNKDDPGKDDRSYLPAAAKQSQAHKDACAAIDSDYWREQCLHWDWSDQIVDRKLSAIAAAILQVGNGRGPDIVALQEVENIGILERLRTEYLADAGFIVSALVEGRDDRGIDVAFLSKLPLAGDPVLHDIGFTGDIDDREKDTRGILQADFRLPDGTVLTGFSVHFPAPYHPTAMRVDAYRRLNELHAKLPAGRPAFAAGDFNTTTAEDRREAMLERYARPRWTVAHEQGCDGCRGTNYYRPNDSWSFLDMILWSPGDAPGVKTQWRLRPGSVAIANRVPEQVTSRGTPARFSLPEGSGVSDHWPIMMSIESQ